MIVLLAAILLAFAVLIVAGPLLEDLVNQLWPRRRH
jgi:hypothetical protein